MANQISVGPFTAETTGCDLRRWAGVAEIRAELIGRLDLCRPSDGGSPSLRCQPISRGDSAAHHCRREPQPDLRHGAAGLVKTRWLIAEPGDVSASCSPRKDAVCFTALLPFHWRCRCRVPIPYRLCSLCSSFRAILLLLLLLLSWPSVVATSEWAELSQLRAKSRTVTRSVGPAVVREPALPIATIPAAFPAAGFPSLHHSSLGAGVRH